MLFSKTFKLAIVYLCAAFYFTTILHAQQISVDDETDFRTQMNTASPDILVSSTIYFTTSFQTSANTGYGGAVYAAAASYVDFHATNIYFRDNSSES